MNKNEFVATINFGQVERQRENSVDLSEIDNTTFTGMVEARIRKDDKGVEKKSIRVVPDNSRKNYYMSPGRLLAAQDAQEAPKGYSALLEEDKKGNVEFEGGQGEFYMVNGALFIKK